MDSIEMIGLGMMIGVLLTMGIYLITEGNNWIVPPPVLNDICTHLTNKTSTGSMEHEKLVCEVPSYDSTTNIIVRPAGATP